MCVCVCVWMVDDCVDPLLSFVRWNCEFRSLPQAILHYFVFYLCVHIVDSSTNKWIYLCVQPSHRRRRGREMPVSTYHIIKCMYSVYLYISLRRSFALSMQANFLAWPMTDSCYTLFFWCCCSSYVLHPRHAVALIVLDGDGQRSRKRKKIAHTTVNIIWVLIIIANYKSNK